MLKSTKYSSHLLTLRMLVLFKIVTYCVIMLNGRGILGKKIPAIAVVGGGIGGTSACFFLHKLLGDEAHVDLYEPGDIGGRLATAEINGRFYETGGSLIHSKNKYMVDFVNSLELTRRKLEGFRFGLYDGKDFLYKESEWQLMTLATLLWRYGFGPVKLSYYIDGLQNVFNSIYSIQADGKSFTTVTDLLNALSPVFVEALSKVARKGFHEQNFSERVIDELIAAGLTANYGQSLDVQYFVGLTSSAAATGNVFSVFGGNKQVPLKLLEYSNASHIQAKVTKITLKSAAGNFIVESAVGEKEYDFVILAVPLAENTRMHIDFDKFPVQFSFPGRYHRTVSTIVQGDINQTYFGQYGNDLVDEILTVKLGLTFNALSRILPVDYTGDKGNVSTVWKIFSPEPLTDSQLDQLFTKRTTIHVSDWLAYPHYEAIPRSDSFVLHKNLFHINAIEWVASAMEMSVIGAKNVCLLLYKSLSGLKQEADRVKEEL